MHVFQAILSRRSVRAYLPRPLEREKLEQILLAGTYAPSGGNNQSTHFLVLENPQAIDRLRRAAVAALAEMEIRDGMYARLITTIQQARREGEHYDFTYGAPVFVLLANKQGYGNAMADCALAAENMFLQATELGVGSCYINQVHWVTHHPRVREVLLELGMAPEEEILLGAVFGYSAMGELPPLKRFGNPITYVP